MYSTEEKFAKKAYKSPNLVTYGDLRKLTQTSLAPIQNLDNNDGSSPGPNNKTGFSM